MVNPDNAVAQVKASSFYDRIAKNDCALSHECSIAQYYEVIKRKSLLHPSSKLAQKQPL